jgi:hypothetical protein
VLAGRGRGDAGRQLGERGDVDAQTGGLGEGGRGRP